ncbi:MAG: helix-turn-helix domain-containing protein [Clostridiaceae bacterium]|nr:helix-turn-helix domain-containing protein [Clostridiaceae bacterium]
MEQANNTTISRKWKHLCGRERIKIESLIKAGLGTGEIAAVIGCSIRTIQREIKRGSVSLAYTKPDAVLTLLPDLPRERTYRTEYSADAAKALYESGFSKANLSYQTFLYVYHSDTLLYELSFLFCKSSHIVLSRSTMFL